MMEDGLVLEADILEAELTKKITERVTKEVTEQVTQQVTEEVTQQVTEEVTQQVTEQVTEQVTQDVMRRSQRETVCKLYSKLKDEKQVSELLELPLDTVREMV